MAAVAAGVAGVSAGCALDWSVRNDLGDAGPDAETPGAEAGTDASGGGDAATDGPIDAAGDAPAVDCMALANDVDSTLMAAKSCTAPGTVCAVTKDPCGCDVSVNPSAEIGYDQTVATYEASCTPKCAACGSPITNTFCVGTTSAATCNP